LSEEVFLSTPISYNSSDQSDNQALPASRRHHDQGGTSQMRNEDIQSNYVQRMMQKRNEGGFTLIELLIVIIILAILAAIVVFAVGTTGQNAAAASCESDAKTVETALETYKAELNSYPTVADQWTALTGTTTVGPNTYGPFLRSQPSTVHYEINFSTTGQVSADSTTDTAGTYIAADDVDTGSVAGVTNGAGLNAICNHNSH
jgi:general secretion pathway protein G